MMSFQHNEVNLEVRYEDHRKCSKTYFTNFTKVTKRPLVASSSGNPLKPQIENLNLYTMYTSISGKCRCHTRCDLWDHSMQARKSAGERSTLDLKPTRKNTQSPKTGAISGSTEWALVQQNLFKKEENLSFLDTLTMDLLLKQPVAG